MTAKAKQILITTERREVYIVRRPGPGTPAGFCPMCGEILTPAWPEAVHTDDGTIDLGPRHMLICTQMGPVGIVDGDE